eukprot:1241568-Ditylum_brightwellii.AAC.1
MSTKCLSYKHVSRNTTGATKGSLQEMVQHGTKETMDLGGAIHDRFYPDPQGEEPEWNNMNNTKM